MMVRKYLIGWAGGRGGLARVAKWQSPLGPHYNLQSFLSDRTHLRPGHTLRALSEPQHHLKTEVPIRPLLEGKSKPLQQILVAHPED